MAFQYRAVEKNGVERQGVVEANDIQHALGLLRNNGSSVVDLKPVALRQQGKLRPNAKANAAAANMIGELEVLLRAGLPLDRALALAIGNIEPEPLARQFVPMLVLVREGLPLSDAFARMPHLFGAAAVAMTEAGEASGTLDKSLARLAEMLERANELRRLVLTSMFYPTALVIVAVGVILLMLLFVVPQFEGLMGANADQLPAASRAVISASQLLRNYGWALLMAIVGAAFGLRMALTRPAVSQRVDAVLLTLPLLGPLIQRIETARFARTLGALVEGQVSLPSAILMAQRTIGNRHMATRVEAIADGVREGSGLSGPLAAARVLPDIAMGFIRTGEESSNLGAMLGRLADVLDRDVRVRLERLVAILTPLITVILAAFVAGIIAAIMSAILGFNDLAISQ